MMDEDAVTGVTSNPTIFQKAISQGSAYDDQLRDLVEHEDDAKEIFIALAGRDVGDACDLMRSVWDGGAGLRGYVSMEVDPTLAYDADGTLAEAKRLHALVDKPNLYVKIPATADGLGPIEEMIALGKSINVTLIFSLERHREVMEAYIRGIERLVEGGGDPRPVSSVASFFVSRVDTEADKRLEGHPELQGKLAVANAKLAYQNWKEVFSGERWEALEAKGASKQWCLWASTSTKNPAYRDVLYVEDLIGPETVNTMPEETIQAFQDHGEVALTIEQDRRRGAPGVRAGRGGGRLGRRRHSHARGRGRAEVHRLVRGAARGDPRQARRARERLISPEELVERIWERDPTVWTGHDEAHWLGWLDEPLRMRQRAGEIGEFAQAIAGEVDAVVLLGMGGSSLAPEVFRRQLRRSGVPRPRHDAPEGDPPARRLARPRADAVRRLLQVGLDARDALALRLLLGTQQARRPVRRGHRPRLGAGGSRALARLACLPRGADDRRPLLGAVDVRAASRCADVGRPRPAARPGRVDAERVPRSGLEPRPGARPGARQRLAGGPRQGRVPVRERSRALARAAARGVDRQGGQGARAGAGRTAGLPGPPGAERRAGRPVRPRLRVLPLGVRDRGRRRDPRDQPVRPAERPGGEGPNGHDPLRTWPGSPRDRALAGRRAHRPGARGRLRRRSRRSSTRRKRRGSQALVDRVRERDELRRHVRARPEVPALDRAAAQGRRADRLLPPDRRRHRRASWRSPGSRSALAGSSRRRLRETMQR